MSTETRAPLTELANSLEHCVSLLVAGLRAHVRPMLAERSSQSPTSSGFANNLGALRSLGLVDYPARGEVAATALLFPEGVPA